MYTTTSLFYVGISIYKSEIIFQTLHTALYEKLELIFWDLLLGFLRLKIEIFNLQWGSKTFEMMTFKNLERFWQISTVFTSRLKTSKYFSRKFLDTFVENSQSDELFRVKRVNLGKSHIKNSLRVEILANIDHKMEYLPQFRAWKWF